MPHMNQAGALVHVYTDGSIRLNHGGTEMGQGLFVKVAQVVAEVFKVDLDRIRPSATSTAEVPNTSPTAASTGSDLNGWAAWEAANTIKQRMVAFAAEHFGAAPADIDSPTAPCASPNQAATRWWASASWRGSAGWAACRCRPPASTRRPRSTGIAAAMRGRPFFYFSFGAAMAEVAVDTLTGESRVLRADLVQDCGASLNPAIDLRPDRGRLRAGPGLAHLRGAVVGQGRAGCARSGPRPTRSRAAATRRPCSTSRCWTTRPRAKPRSSAPRRSASRRLLLATAVWTALKDAIAAVGDHRTAVRLDAPATPERVLAAIATLKG